MRATLLVEVQALVRLASGKSLSASDDSDAKTKPLDAYPVPYAPSSHGPRFDGALFQHEP